MGLIIGILSFAVLLVAIYLLVLVRPPKKTKPTEVLLCDYAHRGLHKEGVPENSLAAFEDACRAGFGIELDVQLSRDGEVMVFHDYTLIRMTGCDKKLCELDAKELMT
ncbi:MAG: glycerophosphodiester phosphodiesterase, partial [Clostridia bacterium]|nr:glycerophosphodiester phosphodiesterase [Clostridia bacterium]